MKDSKSKNLFLIVFSFFWKTKKDQKCLISDPDDSYNPNLW